MVLLSKSKGSFHENYHSRSSHGPHLLLLCMVCTFNLSVYGSKGPTKYHDGTNAHVAGKCELYVGSACSEVLRGRYVFVKSWLRQRSLESRISSWLTTARRTRSVSERCWPHAKALVCFHTFPPCDMTTRKPQNKSFCHDECRFLESGVCKREFLLARSIFVVRKYVPLCEELPGHGTEGFKTCQRLPSLNVSTPAPGLRVEHQQNVTARAHRKASLKCWFTTYPAADEETNEVNVEWYKGKKEIGQTKGKYRVKRKKRRTHRMVSTLIIKDVSVSDAGYYRCTVTQGNKVVESGVLLTIQTNSKRKGKKEKRKDKSKPRNISKIGVPRTTFGKCVIYNGHVCSKHLSAGKSTKIFEYNYSPQSVVERRLLREFQVLQRSSMISRRCKEFGLAVICYNMFQACNEATGEPVPRLCKSDCDSFETVFCRKEVAMARKHNSFSDIVPDCTSLPRKNPFCVPIRNKPDSGTSYTTINPDEDNSVPVYTEDASSITDQVCFTNRGESYRGREALTKSGRVCRPWKEISHNYRVDHSYCRNFGGKNHAPWCHVGNGEKEFCDIPKCSVAGTRSPDTHKDCYSNVGEDYYGLISTTMSGKKCQSWKFHDTNYEVRHNYCRNYEGKDVAPWCYVAGGKKEYCDIPKCALKSAGHLHDESKTPSLVLYVVPTAVALSVILLMVLLILVYMKHRKGDKEDSFTVQVPTCPEISSLKSKSLGGSVQMSKEDVRETTFDGSINKDVPEIRESQLHYIEKIGDGSFGQLWKAESLDSDNSRTSLLIKRVKSDAAKGLMNDFLHEMNLIAGLRHINIIQLMCISSPGENLFMGFESNDMCGLKQCLKMEDSEESQPLNCNVLLDVASQICSALEYLHSNQIIHKDLGTRNCLINGDSVVKVTYFGLGPYLHPEDYFIDQTCYSLPVRWMSPEALRTRRFTKTNDVWSFSILLWELFSCVKMPYEGKTDTEAIKCITKGELLPCPKECPARVYSLMKECWNIIPSERLTFPEIRERLESWNVQIS